MSDSRQAAVPASVARRSMRAMVLTAHGSIHNLEVAHLPVPEVGAREVLVRVQTVAANHRDLFTIDGPAHNRPPSLPHVLGIDPAGVIETVGPDVTNLSPGDRVVVKPAVACGLCATCRSGGEDACEGKETIGVTRAGGFAEFVAVPARNAFRLPDALGFAEASALAHSFPVALHMLRRAEVGADDVVLVTSAAGAVGSGAVQLAAALGARVVAGAGGQEKASLVRDLGPEVVVDYFADPAFAAEILRAVPGGVSVYVESAGNPSVWKEGIRTLAPHGRAVVCGSHGGPIVELDLNRLFRLRLSVLGSSGSTSEDVKETLEMAGAGLVRPPVDSVRPLGEAVAAFERLLARQNRGKVVLQVAAD